MRIALTITELHPGGAETCLANLAEYLHGQGHVVKVWQLWPAPPENRQDLTHRLDQSGIEWASGGALRAWQFPRVIRWLRKELRSYQPDVVQSFLFHANVATAYATKNCHVPFFGGVRVRQPQRWRWWLQSWAACYMQKIICVSQDVADHCIQREGIAADKVEVIPNGIDPNIAFTDVSWSSLGVPAHAPVILFVGRLDEQKGVAELVAHADNLLAALPEHQLVLMGDGRLRVHLEAQTALLRHRRRLHLVGWQPRAIDWMRIAQQLILPAKYEGMPNVVLEAMAAEIPVVTFKVDGTEELLGKSSAQLVPPGDYEALTAAVTRQASDPGLRQQCAASNRSRVADHFDLGVQLARYEAMYVEAVAKP